MDLYESPTFPAEYRQIEVRINTEILAQNIVSARNCTNLSMQALAETVGVTRQAVSRWERGTVPTLENLAKISGALRVRPETLLAGVFQVFDVSQT